MLLNLRTKRSVRVRVLEDEITYIRISRFDAEIDQLPSALKEVKASRGLLLDLRDNKLGDLIWTKSLFPVFKTMDPRTRVAILLNRHTSGAAEDLVAALRPHRQVTLVGEPSASGIKPDIISRNCCSLFYDRQLQCAKLLLQLDRLRIV